MTSPTRSTIAPIGALMLTSLAIGAAGMWLALGAVRRAEPASLPTSAPIAAPMTMAASDHEGIHISPERQQLIGVRTAAVTDRALDSRLRTVGTIAYNETRIAEIHTKIAGWVDDVSVDFVGKQVRQGQPLFTIYSPDLVATQREYLLALKAERQLSTSTVAETRDGARSLLEATRQRLRLWDVTDAQIDALAESGAPRRTLTVYSPSTGIVLERNAFPGQYLTPDMASFKIADLSSLWVIGQIFEYELPEIKLGQAVGVEFPYGQSTRTVAGRITFIYPEVDPQTRRAQMRIEVPNPGLDLKPGTFVTMTIATGDRGRQLAVPQEAVIDTGTRQYVLIARPGGYFTPRPVTVGPPVDAFRPVLAGLAAGELVVTSAQFLIDSESNLQAAMESMAAAPPAPTPASTTPATQTPTPAAPKPALSVAFSSTPDPPSSGTGEYTVTVSDENGHPVTGLAVEAVFFMAAMPSMGMPAMRVAAMLAPDGDGVYRGTAHLHESGPWDVTVTVTRGGQRVARRTVELLVR